MPVVGVSVSREAAANGVRCLLWASPLAMLIGIAVNHGWHWVRWNRTVELLSLAALVALASWPLRRYLRMSAASGFALMWLLALLAFVGVLPVLAVALLALAAMAVGDALLPVALQARGATATVLGLGLIAGLAGWLLPLPIHRDFVYVPLLLLMLVARRRALRSLLIPVAAQWREAVAGAPAMAGFAVMVVGMMSTACWLPTLQFDDLAYHLGLPTQLQEFGVYRFAPAAQVWALAPWAGDVLQGIAQVVAHGEARGALNALWLLVTLRLLWAMCAALDLRVSLAWATLAVFASQPLVPALAAGMQTEAPATAALLALCLLVRNSAASEDGARLRSAAVLSGLLLGLKLTNALAVALLGIGWLLAARGRWRWRALPSALLLGLAVGGSSYVYAAAVTGNPVFPLFNAWFHSPYLAAINLSDGRWLAGFDWTLPWRLSFDSGRYHEGHPGAAGFILVAFASASVVALLHRRTRGLALVGLILFWAPLTQMQYLRYTFPATPLLVVAGMASFAHWQRGAWPQRLAVGLACLQLLVASNAFWMLRTGVLKQRLQWPDGIAQVYARYAPERLLAKHLRGGTSVPTPVLIADPARPFCAEFAGRALCTAWYGPALDAAFDAAQRRANESAWNDLLQRYAIRAVALNPATAPEHLLSALQRLGAHPEWRAGTLVLWRLPEHLPPVAPSSRRTACRGASTASRSSAECSG